MSFACVGVSSRARASGRYCASSAQSRAALSASGSRGNRSGGNASGRRAARPGCVRRVVRSGRAHSPMRPGPPAGSPDRAAARRNDGDNVPPCRHRARRRCPPREAVARERPVLGRSCARERCRRGQNVLGRDIVSLDDVPHQVDQRLNLGVGVGAQRSWPASRLPARGAVSRR